MSRSYQKNVVRIIFDGSRHAFKRHSNRRFRRVSEEMIRRELDPPVRLREVSEIETYRDIYWYEHRQPRVPLAMRRRHT